MIGLPFIYWNRCSGSKTSCRRFSELVRVFQMMITKIRTLTLSIFSKKRTKWTIYSLFPSFWELKYINTLQNYVQLVYTIHFRLFQFLAWEAQLENFLRHKDATKNDRKSLTNFLKSITNLLKFVKFPKI